MTNLPIFVTFPVRPNIMNDDEIYEKDFRVSEIKSYMDNSVSFYDESEIRTTLTREEIANRIKDAYANFPS